MRSRIRCLCIVLAFAMISCTQESSDSPSAPATAEPQSAQDEGFGESDVADSEDATEPMIEQEIDEPSVAERDQESPSGVRVPTTEFTVRESIRLEERERSDPSVPRYEIGESVEMSIPADSVGVTDDNLPPGLVMHSEVDADKIKSVVYAGYATNRDFENGQYGGRLAAEISYGYCVITLPPDHESGNIERPGRRFFFFRESEDPGKHVVLQEVGHASIGEFFGYLADTSPGDVLLFVHGFNVTFEEAAHRTAQLHHDLRFPGQSVFFSWASDGDSGGYVNDGTKIGDSVNDIAGFVESLADNAGVESVYMIGHSMGSRGLTRALVSIKDQISPSAKSKLRELILVEPDISQQIFTSRIAPGLRDLGARVTLYASENDVALGVSQPVNNGVARLGQAGDQLYIADGIQTIDSSEVGVSFFSLNHSEYAENLEFLLELNAVIAGRPPSSRPTLERRARHWYLIPAN